MQRQHAGGLVDKPVWQLVAAADIRQTTAHEALDRRDRVLRIGCTSHQRLGADLAPAAFEVTDNRRQDHMALAVGQAFGHTMAHGGDERMGGSQVDAHRDPTLVRVRCLTGFGYLKKRHVCCWGTGPFE
jgi:hypothetical protein